MPRRKQARTLDFAKMAWKQFAENSAAEGPAVAFYAGFSLALGYARLVGVPSAAEQEAVSEEAFRLSTRAGKDPAS